MRVISPTMRATESDHRGMTTVKIADRKILLRSTRATNYPPGCGSATRHREEQTELALPKGNWHCLNNRLSRICQITGTMENNRSPRWVSHSLFLIYLSEEGLVLLGSWLPNWLSNFFHHGDASRRQRTSAVLRHLASVKEMVI